jgi:aldose sugar dehydrogenase
MVPGTVLGREPEGVSLALSRAGTTDFTSHFVKPRITSKAMTTQNLHRLAICALAFALLASCSGQQADAKNRTSDLPFTVTEMALFAEPWAMTFLPGSEVRMTGTALITEKRGRLLIWDSATKKAFAVKGVPRPSYGGQGGFGDVVAHPGFAGNQLIYLSWVEAGKGGERGAVVGRAKLDRSNAASPSLQGLEIVWRQTPKVSGGGHFGHRIAFGPDGMLYITSGERQKQEPAQDVRQSLGKIIRLTEDGKIPGDNPYSKTAQMMSSNTEAMEQIWSLGHRNPLGLAFDAEGRLWDVEMGPLGGDELNLVKAGANYGWPRASNGDQYSGQNIPDHAPGDGFEPPKVWWNPSISPGGLMIYSGSLFPAWKGDAFIAALGGNALIRVDLNGGSASKADEWDMQDRIREVEQGPDGAIWLLTDGKNGRLLKLTPKP